MASIQSFFKKPVTLSHPIHIIHVHTGQVSTTKPENYTVITRQVATVDILAVKLKIETHGWIEDI
jgi:hypothetical protein